MPPVTLHSPDETHALGVALGRAAAAGDVIALLGDLGAGKTLLVKGLAAGLGVPAEVPVTSPTFTLIHVYEGGRAVLYHVDLYRLERERELEDAGVDDLYRQDAVVAVEWFDRFPRLAPPEYVEVRLTVTGDTSREATLTAHGPRAAALLGRAGV